MFELSAITEPINSENGLKHAVLQSLLNWAKAQENDPIDDGQDKQGWWSSELVRAVGCRDWTLARAKQTTDTLNRVIRYTTLALQWLVDEKMVSSIGVSATYEGERLTRIIDITRLDNSTQQVTL